MVVRLEQIYGMRTNEVGEKPNACDKATRLEFTDCSLREKELCLLHLYLLFLKLD